jgi:toxin ParE1/3/4
LDREDVREVFLGSYRIVYRIYPDFIDVITVFEGHRLFPVEVLLQNQKKDE